MSISNSLIILGQLSDMDVEWLIDNGSNLKIEQGHELITQNTPISTLFVTLKGQFNIIADNDIKARVGAGEILGEMSFIDANPPSATVTAAENAIVHSIPKDLLQEKLKNDDSFAARFYKAIATLLSDRLRTANANNDDEAEELDLEVLDKVHLAGQRFDAMVKRFID